MPAGTLLAMAEHAPIPPDWLTPRKRRGLLVVMLLGYCWIFPWSEQVHNPNEMVRLYMTRAIVDYHTYAIGRRDVSPTGAVTDHGSITGEWGYVNDKAMLCDDPKASPPNCSGWLYPAKAPGMSMLGVGPYWLLKQVFAAAHKPLTKPWIVWWVRLCCAALPTVLLYGWLARHLTRSLRHPELGLAVVLAAGLGSLSLTYGQMFAGHQPAGLALLVAFLAGAKAGQDRSPGAGLWVALAGLGIGLAILIEFPAAPAALLLLAWILLRRRQGSDLLWLFAGGVGPALLLAHFNARAFGAPWQLPYSHLENADFVRELSPGFMGIHLPSREKLAGSLFSPFTGLYFWAPWTALAWLGVLGARRRLHVGDGQPLLGSVRGEALIAWLICLYFLFFQTTHALWRGGWVVGPRYITAIVPFAAIAAAHGLDSLSERRIRWTQPLLAITGCAAIGVTGAATAVCQGFPLEVYNPLREVVSPLLAHGFVWSSPPYWLGTTARAGALPWALALLAGALWLASLLQPFRTRMARVAGLLLSLGLAAALVWALWRVQPPTPRSAPDQEATVRYLMQTWWPPAPRGSTPLPTPGPP